jgi:hypothetical protein
VSFYESIRTIAEQQLADTIVLFTTEEDN